MLCAKCKTSSFTHVRRANAACGHKTTTAHMQLCVRCSYQHNRCEACSKELGYHKGDDHRKHPRG